MDSARLRGLLAGLACPLCGGTRGDTLLIVIDCPGQGAEAVRVQCVRCNLFWSFGLSDNTPPQLSPERAADPISLDDVIEVHCLLRDTPGSFIDLLARAS
jgi:hypothetical protein